MESSSLGFTIGLNPLQSEDRPWKYVPLRHVPVDVNSFSAYGDNLLDNFLNRATWAYATPHNIQLDTPQTERCINCHNNNAIFLTLDKIAQGEQGGANLNLIVGEAPPFPDNLPELFEAALKAVDEAHAADAAPPTDNSDQSAGDDAESFWADDSTPSGGE